MVKDVEGQWTQHCWEKVRMKERGFQICVHYELDKAVYQMIGFSVTSFVLCIPCLC